VHPLIKTTMDLAYFLGWILLCVIFACFLLLIVGAFLMFVIGSIRGFLKPKKGAS
jgi:hypothetical protein